MRNNTELGSAALASSLAILGQTYTAANPKFPFLKRDALCTDGKLPTIQKRGADISGQQWYKPNKRPSRRAVIYQASAGVQHKRTGLYNILTMLSQTR